MISFVRLFCVGIFIGLANVVPGVSGGTIAVVCNVYDKLILLSSLDIRRIRSVWKDIATLAAGIGAGVLLFARLITLLYRLYPVQTQFFFMGIILGSIPFLYEKMKEGLPSVDSDVKGGMLKPLLIPLLCSAVGCVLLAGLFFMQRSGMYIENIQPDVSAVWMVKLFAAGAVAAFAMLIPGISGSFILLLIGVYRPILEAVAALNIPLLIPVAVGVGGGLVCGARVINYILTRFPAPAYGFILGLVASSVLYLFPAVCQPFPMRMLSALALFAGYTAVSLFSQKKETAV